MFAKVIDVPTFAAPYWKVLEISKMAVVGLTTKNALLISPALPNDGFTAFTSLAAGLVRVRAQQKGWNLIDLNGNNASRVNVEDALKNKPVDFIIHYDHGNSFTIYGQNSNSKDPIIDISNVALLKGKATSTFSCETATGIGPLAISAGAKAYLGYSGPVGVKLSFSNEFVEAANAANYELLEGKTFQEAYNKAYNTHTDMMQHILNSNLPGNFAAAAIMLWNRGLLRLLGDPNAKATGLIILKPS